MFKNRIPRFPMAVALSVLGPTLVLGVLATPLPAEEEELPLQFDAVAVNMSNVGPRGQTRLQIRVTRWSSDEERAKLIEAMKENQGRLSRDLANTLFDKESVGTIRQVQSLAYDLRYARSVDAEDGGRVIVLGTDRRIGFEEAWRASRTLDYNVSMIVLTLDENGRGEGQLLLGADFSWDDANDRVVIEHFASEPIRLTNVRLR